MGPEDECAVTGGGVPRAASTLAAAGGAGPGVGPAAGRLAALLRAVLVAATLLAVAGPSRAAAQAPEVQGFEDAVRVEGAPLPIRAEPGLEELARSLASDRAAWAPLPGIGDPATWFREPPTVWVVSDLSRVPGPGTEPWAAGFADASRNLIAIRAGHGAAGGLQGLRRTFRHELAHLALERATGGRATRWLHEGYAQIVSGSWDAGQAWRLRWALFRSEGSVLEQLSLSFPEDEQQAQIAYLLSYTAVNELARRGGSRALESFFRRLSEGATLDQAMRNTYGMTSAQFEERWRKTVQGRYGWLYALSRASVFWLLLTVAMLLLGWRRWRHERERWEELRRKEAAEASRGPWTGRWILVRGRADPAEADRPDGDFDAGDPGATPGDPGPGDAGPGEGQRGPSGDEDEPPARR